MQVNVSPNCRENRLAYNDKMFLRTYRLLRSQIFNEIEQTRSYIPVRIQPLARNREEISEITVETQQDALRNAIAPLWNVPYINQLDIKDEWISYVISRYFSILKEEQKESKTKNTIATVPRPKIHKITPSPILHKYRNKDVYMVRAGVDGNPKTVGHIVGRPSEGKYFCVPPVDVLSPTRHIQVAKSFQDYIRSSPLPACINFSEGGNWTQIQVRTNSKGETMALIKLHPQELTEAQIDEEIRNLKEYFLNGPGSECQLSSLYFQASPFSNASGKMAPFQLLFGNKYLMETLNGRDFALSPGSFFQSNIRMAEIMYGKIISTAKLSKVASVLDLGCGIGTLSILATPYVRGTIGIDMSEEAIEDAKYNARLNNIFSAKFIAGKIERKIKNALEMVEPSSDVVAILNPGRCGVDVCVIRTLRCMPQIGRLLYVACQPDHEWVIRNVLHLIKPTGRNAHGSPFKFQSVTPVDMFPQTTHSELIMKFER